MGKLSELTEKQIHWIGVFGEEYYGKLIDINPEFCLYISNSIKKPRNHHKEKSKLYSKLILNGENVASVVFLN